MAGSTGRWSWSEGKQMVELQGAVQGGQPKRSPEPAVPLTEETEWGVRGG